MNGSSPGSSYPTPWRAEPGRNRNGRTFWFGVRLASRTRVDFIRDVTDEPKCFRMEQRAIAAVDALNTGADNV
jgi:hypothetical protein